MNESRVEVESVDGVADGRMFLPDGAGPFPLVVQYMDAGGLRSALTQLAAPLVAAGYAVLQPNLYWRAGPYAPFDARTVFGDAPERDRLMALMRTVKPADVMDDTRRFVERLAEDPRVATERLRFVGYCLGGRAAFVAAITFAERVAAAAAIHAGGLVTDAPDSPHRGVGAIRARVYVGVADADASCTPAQQHALRDALELAGVDATVELYPGARHGFAMPDFAVYDAAAAARQGAAVLELFASVR